MGAVGLGLVPVRGRGGCVDAAGDLGTLSAWAGRALADWSKWLGRPRSLWCGCLRGLGPNCRLGLGRGQMRNRRGFAGAYPEFCVRAILTVRRSYAQSPKVPTRV